MYTCRTAAWSAATPGDRRLFALLLALLDAGRLRRPWTDSLPGCSRASARRQVAGIGAVQAVAGAPEDRDADMASLPPVEDELMPRRPARNTAVSGILHNRAFAQAIAEGET